MARPRKIGCDYFPHDTKFPEAIEALISAHGNDAGMLWERYRMNAFAQGNAEVSLGSKLSMLRFCEVMRLKEPKVAAMISTAVELSIFDGDAWISRRALLSPDVARDLDFVQSERTRDRNRKNGDELSGDSPGGSPAENGRENERENTQFSRHKGKERKANSLKESAREAPARRGRLRAPEPPPDPLRLESMPAETRAKLAALKAEVDS